MNYQFKIIDDHHGHYNLARKRFDGKYHKVKEYSSMAAALRELNHLKKAIETNYWISD